MGQLAPIAAPGRVLSAATVSFGESHLRAPNDRVVRIFGLTVRATAQRKSGGPSCKSSSIPPNGHRHFPAFPLGTAPMVNSMELEEAMGTTWAQDGHKLGTKQNANSKVGVYLRGKPRIYWLREYFGL
jgi:hypothetical protein